MNINGRTFTLSDASVTVAPGPRGVGLTIAKKSGELVHADLNPAEVAELVGELQGMASSAKPAPAPKKSAP